jgi:hypothetical protein
MANVALIYQNVADAATLSGSGWSVELPLSNLQDRRLHKVARAANLGTGTQTVSFTVDLGAFVPGDQTTYKAYDAIALVNHTLSPKAVISIRSSAVSDFSSAIGLDLVNDDVYKVRQADIDWNWANPKFYSKKVSEIDLYGFIRVYVHPMAAAQSNTNRGVLQANGRYLRITITDEYSESLRNYIDIGRLIIGKRLNTQFNMAFGASLRYEDESIVQPSIGGELFADRRAKKRVMRFTHSELSKAEALSGALDLQRISGITEEVLVIADADDTAFGFKRDFLGRLRGTSDIEHWAPAIYKTSYEIEEIL